MKEAWSTWPDPGRSWIQLRRLTWHNEDVSSQPREMNAVSHSLQPTATPRVEIVVGGRTWTISQLQERESDERDYCCQVFHYMPTNSTIYLFIYLFIVLIFINWEL